MERNKLKIKDFIKNEHWSLRLFYLIGMISFLIHLYYIPNENIELKIFPLLAYTSMIVGFTRLTISLRK